LFLAYPQITRIYADFFARYSALQFLICEFCEWKIFPLSWFPERGQLGLLYAFMGRKEDALREAQRAVESRPISRDVIEGAVVQDFQALVFARTGQTDKAISAIERLLTTPFAVDYADDSITLSDLRTRWEWDPLRNGSALSENPRRARTEDNSQVIRKT
jgi:hypothetical protein